MAGPVIPDGAVRLNGDRIEWCGPWNDASPGLEDLRVDLGDAVLLPGLVNAHCHLDYTHLAGQLAPPRSFPDWIKAILAAKSSSTESDFDNAWRTGAGQLLRSGTTTVANIETRPHALAALRSSTPLRVHSFIELTGVRSRRDPDQLVAEAMDQLAAMPDSTGSLGLSPHAPYSTVPALLEASARAARARGWRITTHIAESREEFEMFMYRRGAMYDWLHGQRNCDDCGIGSPVRHAARHGLLGPDFIAAHVNHLWDDDARLLGQHGVSVVHCPQSHAYFRHQRFPGAELAGAGVNLCLGTDSLASTRPHTWGPPALSLLDEMAEFAAHDTMAVPAEILARATVNGARALGLESRLGTIAPGMLADLCAVPARVADVEVESAVIHHRGAVLATWIGGRTVWRDPAATSHWPGSQP